MRKTIAVSVLRLACSRSPFSPSMASATPNRIETNTTCRIAPEVKALTNVSGMMSRMKLDRVLLLGAGDEAGDSARVERRRIDIEAGAGPDQIADGQADGQSERGDGEEIAERLGADPAERLQIRHAGDAGDDGEEDDRRDDHLDELDEAEPERLQPLPGLRPEPAGQRRRRRCRRAPRNRASARTAAASPSSLPGALEGRPGPVIRRRGAAVREYVARARRAGRRASRP